MLDANFEGVMTAAQAAKLLGVDKRWIQKLAAEDFIERAGRDRYKTVSVIQGYIRSLKEEKKTTSQSAADARLKDARAAEIIERRAIRDHSLIELDEAEAVIDEIAGMLKTEMDGLGARVTRDTPMRKKIDAAVDETFRRASARIAQEVASLGASGAALDPDAAA